MVFGSPAALAAFIPVPWAASPLFVSLGALGFRAFRVQGLGFRASALGFRV